MKRRDKRRAALFGNQPSPSPAKHLATMTNTNSIEPHASPKKKVGGFVFKSKPKTPSASLVVDYDNVKTKTGKSKQVTTEIGGDSNSDNFISSSSSGSKRDITSTTMSSNDMEMKRRKKTIIDTTSIPDYPDINCSDVLFDASSSSSSSSSSSGGVGGSSSSSTTLLLKNVVEEVIRNELGQLKKTFNNDSWIYDAMNSAATELIEICVSELFPKEKAASGGRTVRHNPRNVQLTDQEDGLDMLLSQWRQEEAAWNHVLTEMEHDAGSELKENNSVTTPSTSLNIQSTTAGEGASASTPSKKKPSTGNEEIADATTTNLSMTHNISRLSLKIDFLMQYLSKANTIAVLATDRATEAVESYAGKVFAGYHIDEPKTMIQSICNTAEKTE